MPSSNPKPKRIRHKSVFIEPKHLSTFLLSLRVVVSKEWTFEWPKLGHEPTCHDVLHLLQEITNANCIGRICEVIISPTKKLIRIVDLGFPFSIPQIPR